MLSHLLELPLKKQRPYYLPAEIEHGEHDHGPSGFVTLTHIDSFQNRRPGISGSYTWGRLVGPDRRKTWRARGCLIIAPSLRSGLLPVAAVSRAV